MAQLIVRNLPEEVARRLKVRAALHGRSAEAEHREILKTALLPEAARPSLKALLASMPGEDVDDAVLERPRDLGRDVPL